MGSQLRKVYAGLNTPSSCQCEGGVGRTTATASGDTSSADILSDASVACVDGADCPPQCVAAVVVGDAAEAGVAASQVGAAAEPVRASSRAGKGVINRFQETQHAEWSSAELKKTGERHARVRPPGESYDERGMALENERVGAEVLRAQLKAAHLKIEALILAGSHGTHVDGTAEPDMAERAAAAIMHDTLTEMIGTDTVITKFSPPAGETEELNRFEARWGGKNGAAVVLSITASQLVFHPRRCDTEFEKIPLEHIMAGEIDDEDDETRAALSLQLSSGKCILLDFGWTGAHLRSAMLFEKRLRDALAHAVPPTTPKQSKTATRVSSCQNIGKELRQALLEVSRLKSLGKAKEAAAKLDRRSCKR